MSGKKYEYIGKREIYRRAQNVLHIELPELKELAYSQFEGCEWLENSTIKITSQAGGTWIGVTDSKEHSSEILCNYSGGVFKTHYVNGADIKRKANPEAEERLIRLLGLDLDNLGGDVEKQHKRQVRI